MTESEVADIERALKTTLPDGYRRTLVNYPFPAYFASDDSPLFDNAQALIDLNRQYHEGFAGIPPWPESLLFVGDDGAASTYAIDQSDPQLPVLLLDNGHPDKILESHDQFDSWLDHLRREVGDGLDQSIRPITWQPVVILSLITAMIASFIGYALSLILP